MNRRQFTAAVAAGSTMALGLPNATAAEDSQPFSFLLLGDTHFDRLEHHDLKWMREHFAKDIPQVENYCRLTKEELPKLLNAAKKAVSQSTTATEFALHVGDLVEGICGNERLAKLHCEEAWDFFQQANLGVPLLMTKGNHDVTGPGSAEAFEQVLLQCTAAELGRDDLSRSSYAFHRGDNLFAVFDAYDRSAIDWLEQVTNDNSFKRLFVLMHLPVVPYNARSHWRVFNHPRQTDRRERLLDLLGKHHAVVLCGHLHKYSFLVRRCRTGRFAQLAISSVKKPASSTRFESVEDYGPRLTDLEPAFSVETLESRQSILASEKQWIEHFEYRDSSGFAMFDISSSNVRARVYVDEPSDEARQVNVSDLLG